MSIEIKIKKNVIEAINNNYNHIIDDDLIQIQKTRKEFVGDFTIIVFPFLPFSKKSPEQTASEIGLYLKETLNEISDFNVIKGFLNLVVDFSCWLSVLKNIYSKKHYGYSLTAKDPKTILIEYSSPNTNKPLHLGHIRNNLLGFSLSNILKANGHKVVKLNLVNDRGIHICKSMLAWKKWGKDDTPEKAGKKGDHFVGDYYVKFDQEYKMEVKKLINEGLPKEEAKANTPLLIEAQEMLKKWEAKDEGTIKLWKKMNTWVYKGFDETYNSLGVNFDKIYYESETYKLGKSIILDGLEKNKLIRKQDGSVWADLTRDGLDEKILLRSDGTSVYMTQDLGTAIQRFQDYKFDKHIYVVGNEQNYHFKVLFVILGKLGYEWAKNLIHLSYGMVELPSGKMKSREGKVVDADELILEMFDTARLMSQELGKLEGYSQEERGNIIRIIGLGALKYFILKVDPIKNMSFDPKESIDFNGNTGPFVQYTFARIQSVLKKAKNRKITIPSGINTSISINRKEIDLIRLISDYPVIVKEAGENLSPALIANYTYELVKEYNQFYHDFSILKVENNDLRGFRLILSLQVARIIKSSMGLLGIEVPERM